MNGVFGFGLCLLAVLVVASLVVAVALKLVSAAEARRWRAERQRWLLLRTPRTEQQPWRR